MLFTYDANTGRACTQNRQERSALQLVKDGGHAVHPGRHFSKLEMAGSSVEKQEHKILISGFILRARMSLMWIQLVYIFVLCCPYISAFKVHNLVLRAGMNLLLQLLKATGFCMYNHRKRTWKGTTKGYEEHSGLSK